MTERSQEPTYSDAEVKARLQEELPHWYLDKGWIRRKYKTHSWKGTLMVINTVGHLAEAAFHHPDITASYAWVEIRLMNHAAKGISDKDFELARKIEDVVAWQPGGEGGALEGTPSDPGIGGRDVRVVERGRGSRICCLAIGNCLSCPTWYLGVPQSDTTVSNSDTTVSN